MNSEFLNICQLQQSDQGQSQGSLALSNYKGNLSVSPLYLLLEGVNQAAVRSGRKVIEGGDDRNIKVLPVSINNFKQHQQVSLTDYDFVCQSDAFGNSARLAIEVFEPGNTSSVIEAQITVSRL